RLFSSKIEAALIQKVLTAPIASLATISGADVPPSLCEAIQRGLAREPARRIASAAELIAAIEESGAPIATPREVGALVEKLAGKSISAQKQELAAAAAASVLTPKPPPPLRAPNRKATLVGLTMTSPASEPPKPLHRSEGATPSHRSEGVRPAE